MLPPHRQEDSALPSVSLSVAHTEVSVIGLQVTTQRIDYNRLIELVSKNLSLKSLFLGPGAVLRGGHGGRPPMKNVAPSGLPFWPSLPRLSLK